MSAPRQEEWRERLDAFARATPDLVRRRELCRRSDSKFVLTPRAAGELVASLGHDYAVLPAGDELLAAYRTLYFDTPELDLYHDHRRGRRIRHKVRIRHYPDRRVSRLEVKSRRSALETAKSWRERAYSDEALTRDDHAFIARLTGIARPLIPQAWTSFRRLTLLGLGTRERVTLDLDLRVGRGAEARVLEGIAIVEIKQWPYCRATPAMEALRRAGHRPAWASKYCSAIAFTHPGVPVDGLLPGLRILTLGAA